uniref:Uncharacterized protein n=1 Tax=Tetranychus urticae TaxID=32264 RepID=T1KWB7_TETUR
MKLFAVIALFALIATVFANSWKEDKHWGHHQHGKIGYKVDVHHGGWGKHDKGWTELHDSRDKTTGHGHHGHSGHGWKSHGWKP